MLRRIAQDPAHADPWNAFKKPLRLLSRRLRILFIVSHRVAFGFVRHDGMSWSAAMAFWLVLSLPPLVIASSSVAVQLIGTENARDVLAEQIVAQLPAEGGLIRDLVTQDIGLATLGGVATLVFLMFSGSRVFAALVNAVNVMWRHVERVGFVRREGMRLLLTVTVGGMLVASVLAQLAVVAFEDDIGPIAGFAARWGLPFLLVLAGLLITYRLLPHRRATWKTALAGALIAAVGLRIAQAVFTLLLGTVLEFEQGYGPLAEVALLATWAFVASVIVLLGAEIVATLDRHRLPHIPLPSSHRGEPEGDAAADEPDDDRMG
jgi:membrane protein